MKSHIVDNTLCYDCCEHLEFDERGNVNTNMYGEVFAIGTDKEGREHLLFLCLSCGEGMERKMFINLCSKLNLKVIVNKGIFMDKGKVDDMINVPSLWYTRDTDV